MKTANKLIIFLFTGLLLCGCALQTQSNSLDPNKQEKEWNELFETSNWEPINDEKMILEFDKKAM